MKDKLREMGVEMASPAFLTMERHLSGATAEIFVHQQLDIFAPTNSSAFLATKYLIYLQILTPHFETSINDFTFDANLLSRLFISTNVEFMKKKLKSLSRLFISTNVEFMKKNSNLCLALDVDLGVGFPPVKGKTF